MRKMDLNEIRQIEFDLLKHFKLYCNENHLRYFLSNGTLLGAIKYKGFIPWDDDIDVLMPREDYDRLVKDYPSNDCIRLLSEQNCRNYIFPFAKLSHRSTLIQNQTVVKYYEYGVHIDILPLDAWNEDTRVAKRDAKYLRRLCRKLSFSSSCFCKGRSLLRSCIKNILICCMRIVGWKYYHKKLSDATQRRLFYSGRGNCGCVVWPVYGEREIMPAEVFSDTVEVEFEGEQFPAPIGYDTYLRSLYGDYEKDPPLEKQRSHHKYTAYRI